LMAELNATNNAVIRSYLWGLELSGTLQGAGGVGGLLAVTIGGSGTQFAALGGNGNVAGLYDIGTTNWSARYEYGPFGEGIRASGLMAKTNPVRFSTKYQDDETDFLYYGFRYYNPSTGRWLSRDPLGDEAFLRINPVDQSQSEKRTVQEQARLLQYVFVRNDGVNAFDLWGLYDNSCCDDCTIEYYRNILIRRYNDAKQYLDPHRPSPMPDQGAWSCLSISINIRNFMSPTPPCWTCYVEERWENKRGGPYNTRFDENTIVCTSHPKSGTPKKITFDYWHNRPPGENYSGWFLTSYPLQGEVQSTARHADCAHRAMPNHGDYRHLDAIIYPTSRRPNPARP